MKLKKQLSLTMAVIMLLASASCGTKQNENVTKDGKIVLTVDRRPDKEAAPEYYESKMRMKEEFMELYPDIEFDFDPFHFDVATFSAKAEGGTLPTVFSMPLTEAKKVIEAGYVEPVTQALKDVGWYDKISTYILEKISADGEIYFVPERIYTMGIAVNIDLFEQAGYVDAEGNLTEPQTFEELAEMAKTIKEVTGKAGFVIPTMNNIGGWNFMSLAWAYGTKFMEETEDGWKSTFDSEECANAFRLLQKMKWEDNSMPENILIDNTEAEKMIATGQVAMMIAHNNQISSMVSYGMDINNVGFLKMPGGPARRVTLIGAEISGIKAGSTEEQKAAAMKWFEFFGISPNLTDEAKVNMEENYKISHDKNDLIGINDLMLWNEKSDTAAFTEEMITKYTTINPNHVKSFNDKTGIEYSVEEPVCTQNLYKLIDDCLQKILTEKDVDCREVVRSASETFQRNFLDLEK